MDFEHIRQILQADCGLSPKRLTVLGVSGGADSLCLLHVFHRLGFNIIVAHMDHAIRVESADDASFVAHMAGQLGVLFVSERVDVVEFAAKEKMSLEEAARVVRYRFLFDQAHGLDAQAVAVAHHADDQVETVLMHFLRGSGISGLKGMEYSSYIAEMHREIPLVRPLLGVWREEIDEYCQQEGLEPRIDGTNQDTRYYRNRLRHELIPYLTEYNPGIKTVIWNMSRNMAGDHGIIRLSTAALWESCFLSRGEGYIELSLSVLRGLQTGESRNIIRCSIEHLRPYLRDIGFDAIDRVVQFIQVPSRSFEMDVTDRLKVFIENGSLFISDWDAELPDTDIEYPTTGEDGVIYLAENGTAELNNHWLLRCKVIEEKMGWTGWKEDIDAGIAWLDRQSVSFPLQVRTWKESDRFQPLGMAGKTVKLSDYWVNIKMPRRVRRRYPLICSGEDIVWVPGYRLAHSNRITGNTTQFVCIRLERS